MSGEYTSLVLLAREKFVELRCRAASRAGTTCAAPAPAYIITYGARLAQRPGVASLMRYFPLFLDLDGKPVLLVGGGEVAARKFSLLADAGAKVTVVAPQLGDELAARAGARRARRITRASSRDADIEGAWLVVAATDDRAVNAAVAAAANAARIPCNVVDDRELSSFIMPAIIDRSPVQIAVSTGGTSPVLARLIRERLETLLDSSLGTLAAFADRWRERGEGASSPISARGAGSCRGCSPAPWPLSLRAGRDRAGRGAHAQGARDAAMPFRTDTSCWSAPARAIPAS